MQVMVSLVLQFSVNNNPQLPMCGELSEEVLLYIEKNLSRFPWLEVFYNEVMVKRWGLTHLAWILSFFLLVILALAAAITLIIAVVVEW